MADRCDDEGARADGAAEAFAAAARRFCTFVDGAAALTLAERLLTARTRLAELVHLASELPAVDAGEPDPDDEGATPVDAPGFAELDGYRVVFDPYGDGPATIGSLADDLADVYRDLGRGLAAFDTGAIAAAIWEWRFGFHVHWGRHAVDALAAIHAAIAAGSPMPPTPSRRRS